MKNTPHSYNGPYTGSFLDRVAFPLGGLGAGMICIEGTGALSHVSLANQPNLFNEPILFSAFCVNDKAPVARVLEGPVPMWKAFGNSGTGRGSPGKMLGLPRFEHASFLARFPFASIQLRDAHIPLRVELTAWSPFTPGDADNSSLPVAALEYRFVNPTARAIHAVYSFHQRLFTSNNFFSPEQSPRLVRLIRGGYIATQTPANEQQTHPRGDLAVFVDTPSARVNGVWLQGPQSAWNNVRLGLAPAAPPDKPSSGASIYVPFRIGPRQEKTIRLMLCWYYPTSALRLGADPATAGCPDACACSAPDTPPATHEPWYAGRFQGIDDVAAYWIKSYRRLRKQSALFRECFYDSTLPAEVTEAVAANLTILKSPTVLRQKDGRLWGWEGCNDASGCCHGSCTHVWNYAQSIPHLFPDLERSLRHTEFFATQNDEGRQAFRAGLPIRPTAQTMHPAADGQLGGIMKVYRDWRISGDTDWLKALWPNVRQSLDYCIRTWDEQHTGLLHEPHHNTYDIEFWGPESMGGTFYLGALKAATLMGKALGEAVSLYATLFQRGRAALEQQLFNGEYFEQKVEWRTLKAGQTLLKDKPAEAAALIEAEGPNNQFGTGCLSDGMLGQWMADVCGLGALLDPQKVRAHLEAVYRHNFKKDLFTHHNPARATYAMGHEAGLLLCTWPRGGRPTIPFFYADEVWTGIEYQVAAHLMMQGRVRQGLDLVRAVRDRYDGRIRNPFNEYECGHWYARAMSSYALIQGLTGARYDAVDKILYLAPSISGDFRAFLSTATGFGIVGIRKGKPFLTVRHGKIPVRRIVAIAR